MSEKLINFRMDADKFNELKMLALKERVPVKNLISGMIEDYVKSHTDGNPQFTIDQFKDPDFIACPAFYRNVLSWDNYFKSLDEKDLIKFRNQLIMIDKKLCRFI